MGWNKMKQQAHLDKTGGTSRNKSVENGYGGSSALEMMAQMANMTRENQSALLL